MWLAFVVMWRERKGKWQMENVRWGMEDVKWQMEIKDGRLKMKDKGFKTRHRIKEQRTRPETARWLAEQGDTAFYKTVLVRRIVEKNIVISAVRDSNARGTPIPGDVLSVALMMDTLTPAVKNFETEIGVVFHAGDAQHVVIVITVGCKEIGHGNRTQFPANTEEKRCIGCKGVG